MKRDCSLRKAADADADVGRVSHHLRRRLSVRRIVAWRHLTCSASCFRRYHPVAGSFWLDLIKFYQLFFLTKFCIGFTTPVFGFESSRVFKESYLVVLSLTLVVPTRRTGVVSKRILHLSLMRIPQFHNFNETLFRCFCDPREEWTSATDPRSHRELALWFCCFLFSCSWKSRVGPR